MMNERSWLLTIQAAATIQSVAELFDALAGLADHYAAQGQTQSAADLLAFLLLQPDLAEDTAAQALESWEALESHICPRVLWDAREFASGANLNDIVEYVFAGTDSLNAPN